MHWHDCDAVMKTKEEIFYEILDEYYHTVGHLHDVTRITGVQGLDEDECDYCMSVLSYCFQCPNLILQYYTTAYTVVVR